MALPSPPKPPAKPDPAIEQWPAGKPIYRVHDRRYAASTFNPGQGRGRFHPFSDLSGQPVPTLYGADTLDGALSESVFRSIPVRGPGRAIGRSHLFEACYSVLIPIRDLRLAALHGFGLGRLGVERLELIESDAAHYGETVLWASALHRLPARVDGLAWVSRQHDTSRAIILFGDRVLSEDLRIEEGPMPLGWGKGLNRVLDAAERAGIRISF